MPPIRISNSLFPLVVSLAELFDGPREAVSDLPLFGKLQGFLGALPCLAQLLVSVLPRKVETEEASSPGKQHGQSLSSRGQALD
jgi:hypothetical protein